MISRGGSWSRPALVSALYLGLAAVALAWGTLRGQPSLWRAPSAAGREPYFWSGLAAGIGAGLGIVMLSRLAVRRMEWARALHRDLRSLLHPLTDLEIVVLAGASSVGEELFFRGALMPALGIWASSAIFALLHIGPKARYLPWTAASLVVGVLFSALFLWSGDLTGAIAAHFTVNFLNLRHLKKNLPDGAPDKSPRAPPA